MQAGDFENWVKRAAAGEQSAYREVIARRAAGVAAALSVLSPDANEEVGAARVLAESWAALPRFANVASFDSLLLESLLRETRPQDVERLSRLPRALWELPALHLRVVLLRNVMGMAMGQVARSLMISVADARQANRAGLRQLANAVASAEGEESGSASATPDVRASGQPSRPFAGVRRPARGQAG